MKKHVLVLICLCLATVTLADVFVDVYEEDGTTLFDNRSVPVGTKLSLIATSDQGQNWWGSLAMADDNILKGVLSPRYNDYNLSVYPQAGAGAMIALWEEPAINGFDLYATATSIPGNWFILDYTALTPGLCEIGFYDHNKGQDFEPGSFIAINNVIPEPMTLTLLGAGAMILMRQRQRVFKNKSHNK